MFHAVILGHALDEEGDQILDCVEAAQDWLSPERTGSIRRYDCGIRFDSAEAAIDWFDTQSLYCHEAAHLHVEFGIPGKNAP